MHKVATFNNMTLTKRAYYKNLLEANTWMYESFIKAPLNINMQDTILFYLKTTAGRNKPKVKQFFESLNYYMQSDYDDTLCRQVY